MAVFNGRSHSANVVTDIGQRSYYLSLLTVEISYIAWIDFLLIFLGILDVPYFVNVDLKSRPKSRSHWDPILKLGVGKYRSHWDPILKEEVQNGQKEN